MPTPRWRPACSTSGITRSTTPSAISPSGTCWCARRRSQRPPLVADALLPEDLKYDAAGLLTVVVQHHSSGQVLMVGHANREAVERTRSSGKAWFFSRSRQQLWQKGETSGNVLDIVGVRVDCDGDALIYVCVPAGPTCHTGEGSCFYRQL